MTVAVHVTHEAVKKLGGIGSVIHGLVVSKNYQKLFPNTLLYTPLFSRDGDPLLRLGDDSEVLYSGLDHFDKGRWREGLAQIERGYGVQIVYGKKKFSNGRSVGDASVVDVVAVDIWGMNDEAVNFFKFKLWKNFGIQSDRYPHDRDYEQYLRIGAVLKDIFEVLYGADDRAVIFSHEYMGMPSALAFAIEKKEGRRKGDQTVFYAHEVSTARMIVEKHPGHDLSFYNILQADRDEGVSLEDEFGSFSSYSRNELIKRAPCLDFVFAVGDFTKEEFLYLCPKADADRIKVVYNGIPVEKVPYSEKERGVKIVGDYCERLFNFRPDFIFTHVARLIVSKAMWRDIRLLYHLDEHLFRHNLKGFFVLLSTLVADGRPNEGIFKMEADYGWPVVHHEKWPDLVGPEVDIYCYLELFNARSKAIKGVFLNQFGFDRKCCGERVPEDASLLYLRLASDIEFGLSIYEPFGIAQLETLPYGGVPLVSSVCGSTSLLKNTVEPDDYLIVDFTNVPSSFRDLLKSKVDFKNITKEVRDLVETEICVGNAPRVSDLLVREHDERKVRFKRMQERSRLLNWDYVAARIGEFLQLGS